jgi:hypothetical protein
MISPGGLAASQARVGGYDELHLAALRAEGRTRSRQAQRSKLAARALHRSMAAGMDRDRAKHMLEQERDKAELFAHDASSFHAASGVMGNKLYRSKMPLPWQVYVSPGRPFLPPAGSPRGSHPLTSR